MGKQCLDISQMQHLKELGVNTSKASMVWVNKYYNAYGDDFERVSVLVDLDTEDYQRWEYAFTLQDILDLLSATVDDDYRLYIDKGLVLWTVGYVDAVSEEIYEDFRERELIDAAYKMLCWVVENGYLEKNKQ